MRYAVLILATLVAALCLGGGFVIYDLTCRLDRAHHDRAEAIRRAEVEIALRLKVDDELDRALEKLGGWRKFGDRYREWFETRLEQSPPRWPPLPLEAKP